MTQILKERDFNSNDHLFVVDVMEKARNNPITRVQTSGCSNSDTIEKCGIDVDLLGRN